MRADNPILTRETQEQVKELESLGWYHSIELPDGRIIEGFQKIDQLKRRIQMYPIPEDLSGKRVLDIGAWDGWFSFEMERRGATVVALDLIPGTKFHVAKQLLGSGAEHVVMDVLDISPERLGYFDIVLFFGVLYHLKHPLLGLERCCTVATDLLCVESFVTDEGADPFPRMDFYETDELAGQFDNWSGPNVACLLAWCRSIGCARTEYHGNLGNRAHVTCYRKWPDRTSAGTGDAPYIVSFENAISRDHDFSSQRDDYVSLWFKAAQSDLTKDEVFPQVGPFGSRPVFLKSSGGDGWHAVFKLPLGLRRGWHDMTVQVRDSRASNTIKIALDHPDPLPLPQREMLSKECRIEIVTDGKTWERYRVHAGVGSCISLWVRDFPPGLSRNDVSVRLGAITVPSIFVSDVDREGLVQINAMLPAGLAPGQTEVTVLAGTQSSQSVPIELIP